MQRSAEQRSVAVLAPPGAKLRHGGLLPLSSAGMWRDWLACMASCCAPAAAATREPAPRSWASPPKVTRTHPPPRRSTSGVPMRVSAGTCSHSEQALPPAARCRLLRPGRRRRARADTPAPPTIPADVLANYEAGHVCWDDHDVMAGRPTGAVRASFGFASTEADAHAIGEASARRQGLPEAMAGQLRGDPAISRLTLVCSPSLYVCPDCSRLCGWAVCGRGQRQSRGSRQGGLCGSGRGAAVRCGNQRGAHCCGGGRLCLPSQVLPWIQGRQLAPG